MGKRIKFSFFTWVVLLFIVVSGILFLQASMQVKKAQDNAENYKNSVNCIDPHSCREIKSATVESSQTVRSSNTIRIHRGYRKTFTEVSYYVRLRLQNFKVHEVIILPNLEIEDNFNFPNIYFPIVHSEYENFAEYSIPERSILNVEIWNGEPTIIFTKYINVDRLEIDNSPVLQLVESTFSGEEPEDLIEYAVPTTNNPLVTLHLQQDKFNQTITYISVFGLLIVGLKAFVTLK